MDDRIKKTKEESDTINVRYYWAIGIYIFVLVLLTINYSIRSTIFVGIVIGSIFPFISFLYLYKNYISEKKEIPSNKLRQMSILSWLLPAFFLHIIIIFGFSITLSTPTSSGFKGSFYTSFYEYGKLFERFSEKGLDIIEKEPKEFKNYVTYYGSFFREGKRKKRETRLQRLLIKWFPEEKEDNSKSKDASISKKKDASSDSDKTQRSTSKNDKEYTDSLKKFSEISARISRIPFFLAITFGFLGALIFCLRDAISRYGNVDLYPKVYIFYIIRFIISASLAVALSSFIMVEFPVILAPFIFFGIGYFPERAIKYIDNKMTNYFGIKTTEYKLIPLTDIQGLTPEKTLRLREVGIEDVQHLALADIDFLEKNLPYNKELLCDWIAQSILYLQFPENIEFLRKMGIRNILQLKDFDPESPQVKKQIEDKSLGEKELKQIEYLKYIVSLPHITDRLSKLMDNEAGCP